MCVPLFALSNCLCGKTSGRRFTTAIRFLYLIITLFFVLPFFVIHNYDPSSTTKQPIQQHFKHTTSLRSKQTASTTITTTTTAATTALSTTSSTTFQQRFLQIKQQLSSFKGKSRARTLLNLCQIESDPTPNHPLPILAPLPSTQLRLIQLNTFVGFQEKIRLQWFNSWIQTQSLDILTLQELVR